MLLTRKNLRAGQRLQSNSFPIEIDEKTMLTGYKLGYCDRCNDPIIVQLREAREIAENFHGSITFYFETIKHLTKQSKPNVPFTVRIAKWLINSNEEYKNQFNKTQQEFI